MILQDTIISREKWLRVIEENPTVFQKSLIEMEDIQNQFSCTN